MGHGVYASICLSGGIYDSSPDSVVAVEVVAFAVPTSWTNFRRTGRLDEQMVMNFLTGRNGVELDIDELLGDPFEGHYSLLQVVDLVIQKDDVRDATILEINPMWFRDLMKENYHSRHLAITTNPCLSVLTAGGPLRVVPNMQVTKEEIFRFRR